MHSRINDLFLKNVTFPVLSVLTASSEEVRIALADTLTIDELNEKEVRRDSLCRKYGNEYGAFLVENKIELGMTKEMCQVVLFWKKTILLNKSYD